MSIEFIKDYKFRQWLYGVLVAVFAVLAGYGFVTAEESQNYLNLVTAFLNLGGAGAFALAANKAKPAGTDKAVHRGKYGDYTEEN